MSGPEEGPKMAVNALQTPPSVHVCDGDKPTGKSGRPSFCSNKAHAPSADPVLQDIVSKHIPTT